MVSFTQDQSMDNSDDHRQRRCTILWDLKRYGSTDSLSAWSPSEYTRNEYALRQISLGCTTKRLPPIYIDREKINEVFQQDSFAHRQRPRSMLDLKKYNSAYELRVENARLRRTIKVLENKLEKNNNHQKEQRDHVMTIDKGIKMLSKESSALKMECERILLCGVGDQEIVNRIQAHLNKIKLFFQQQVSQINSKKITCMSLEHKTFLLEHLETLFVLINSRMDEWMNLVIDIKQTNDKNS